MISWPSGDQRGVACDWSAHGGELDGVGPVGIGQPDFQFSRAIRCKGDPAAVGGKLRVDVQSVEEMATTGGDEAGAPGAEVSTRQIFAVSESCERRPAGAAGRAGGARPPASTRPRPRRGVAPAGFRRRRPASKDFPWRKREFPCRRASTLGTRHSERGGREAPGFAAGGQTFSQRKPVKLTGGEPDVAAEDQRTAVRRDRRVAVARGQEAADWSTAFSLRSRAKPRTRRPAFPRPGNP